MAYRVLVDRCCASAKLMAALAGDAPSSPCFNPGND